MSHVAYDDRVRVLSAMNKRSLAAIYRNHTRTTVIYQAAPPERWSKDELVSSILREEYPAGVTP